MVAVDVVVGILVVVMEVSVGVLSYALLVAVCFNWHETANCKIYWL